MKLPGVDSVEVSLRKASADIELAAGNRVSMPQLREVLRKSGYPTRDATVTARGTVAERDGKRVFDLLNGSEMELGTAPSVSWPGAGMIVEVTGTTRAAGKKAETLVATSVTGGR